MALEANKLNWFNWLNWGGSHYVYDIADAPKEKRRKQRNTTHYRVSNIRNEGKRGLCATCCSTRNVHNNKLYLIQTHPKPTPILPRQAALCSGAVLRLNTRLDYDDECLWIRAVCWIHCRRVVVVNIMLGCRLSRFRQTQTTLVNIQRVGTFVGVPAALYWRRRLEVIKQKLWIGAAANTRVLRCK